MNANPIQQVLPDKTIQGGGLWGGRLLFFSKLPSTNQWALAHISACRHGDAVWTSHQTCGLGRSSRNWITPANQGLTLSYILLNTPGNDRVPLLGQLGALAVQKTLEDLSLESRLKWPNDILVDGKKIAGILSEADTSRNAFILGIGLNVSMQETDFRSMKLEQPATSLFLEGVRRDLDEVRSILTANVEKELGEAWKEEITGWLARWKESDWLQGSSIEVRSAGCVYRGMYDGLNADGRLRLIDEYGRLLFFWSGDVLKVRSQK